MYTMRTTAQQRDHDDALQIGTVLVYLVNPLVASNGITIAICSFCRREKKQKQFMFVCTLCCLGTESNVYKTGELKDKAELKDRKARCI